MRYAISESESINNYRDPPRTTVHTEESFVRFLLPVTFPAKQNKRWAAVWMPCTFTSPSREAGFVDVMSFFVADLDTCDSAALEGHLARWKAEGRKFLVHSSHGYAPPQKAKARVVFFLSAPIPVGTQWRWSDALWPALMKHVGLSADADTSCRDASRAFYVPCKPTRGSPQLAEFHDGAPIDIPATLGHILDAPLAQYDYSRPYVSREDPSRPVSMESLAYRLVTRYPRGPMKRVVDMVLHAIPTEDGQGRHEVIRKFTMGLSFVAEPEESTPALLAIMNPWITAMTQKYGPRGESWRAEAERALVGAREKRPTWEAYEAALTVEQLGWNEREKQ